MSSPDMRKLSQMRRPSVLLQRETFETIFCLNMKSVLHLYIFKQFGIAAPQRCKSVSYFPDGVASDVSGGFYLNWNCGGQPGFVKI